MNGILQDVAQGTHKLIAARYTFRRSSSRPDGAARQRVGFGVLAAIDIR